MAQQRSQHKQPAQTQGRQPGRETEMTPRPDYAPLFPGVGKLDGQVALIAGGDSGIAGAVAVGMANEGADIAIAYLDEHDDTAETKRAVEARGGATSRSPATSATRSSAPGSSQRP